MWVIKKGSQYVAQGDGGCSYTDRPEDAMIFHSREAAESNAGRKEKVVQQKTEKGEKPCATN